MGPRGYIGDSRGRLIDDEDNQVKTVWKTWAWETMLEQLREDATGMEVAPPIRTGYPEDKVRLIDVLLRPEVLVYEPLWTAIPSNKAILPVLWSLFPNHRYLLEAGFELTPELIKNGYAQKPIAGRRGDNVKLIGECKSVLDSKMVVLVSRRVSINNFGVYQKWKTNMFRSVLYCRWALWW